MLLNWYAVYTRPQKEKVVSGILAKKGLDCFCPVINTAKGKNNNKKAVFEPLFMSYVFVYMRDSDISSVKSIPGVVSFLYWKSKPAIIKSEEIDAIRYFTTNFINIKLVKSTVSITEGIKVKDSSILSFNENIAPVKYHTVRLHLPSLGYTMIAERGVTDEEPVDQEAGLFRTFPRKINSFFFN